MKIVALRSYISVVGNRKDVFVLDFGSTFLNHLEEFYEGFAS